MYKCNCFSTFKYSSYNQDNNICSASVVSSYNSLEVMFAPDTIVFLNDSGYMRIGGIDEVYIDNNIIDTLLIIVCSNTRYTFIIC